MRPDHRRWLKGLEADPSRRLCESRRCRVRPGQSPVAGSRRNLRAWVLLGAVEWWLSRSRAAAVTGEAGRWSLRWPPGSLGYAVGTWTPGGAGFSTAPLTVPGRLPQASVQPSPPLACPAHVPRRSGQRRLDRSGGVCDTVETVGGQPHDISAVPSGHAGGGWVAWTASVSSRGRHNAG